jgi:hypothetical protein
LQVVIVVIEEKLVNQKNEKNIDHNTDERLNRIDRIDNPIGDEWFQQRVV